MRKLTYRPESGGEAYADINGNCVIDSTLKGEVVELLAAYEETGLTPEEIKDLKKTYLYKCKTVDLKNN